LETIRLRKGQAMSRLGFWGSLGAVGMPLLAAALAGAPSALADGGIGLPAVAASSALPVALPSAVVATVPATVAVVTSVTDGAVSVVPSASTLPSTLPAAPAVKVAAPPTVAATRTEPVTTVTRPVRRHSQAPARLSHRRHVAVSVSPPSPAPQAGRFSVTRDRRVPTPPTPDRTVTGLFPGSAAGAGAGFVLLLAVAAAVLAVVRPRLGERLTSLLRVPHPAVLALELERPG
jgi:hypothetical protein